MRGNTAQNSSGRDIPERGRSVKLTDQRQWSTKTESRTAYRADSSRQFPNLFTRRGIPNYDSAVTESSKNFMSVRTKIDNLSSFWRVVENTIFIASEATNFPPGCYIPENIDTSHTP